MTLTIPAEMPRKKRMKSDFGKRLIEFRKARGLTQYDLADLIIACDIPIDILYVGRYSIPIEVL